MHQRWQAVMLSEPALQQLSDAGLVEMKETKTVQSVDGDQKLYAGRTITSAGHKLHRRSRTFCTWCC